MNSQIPSTAADAAMRFLDNGAEAARHASSSLGVARRAQGRVSSRVDSAQDAAAAVVQPAVERPRQLGQQTMALMRNGAQQLREQARHARNATIVHVRRQPLESVLMAAAVGAGLMAVATYLTRRP